MEGVFAKGDWKGGYIVLVGVRGDCIMLIFDTGVEGVGTLVPFIAASTSRSFCLSTGFVSFSVAVTPENTSIKFK